LQGEVDELYMMDIDEKKAKAQAMDVNDAVSYIPHKVIATAGPIEGCGDCDILVFSAGPLNNLGLMGLLFLSQILQMWWPLTYVNI